MRTRVHTIGVCARRILVDGIDTWLVEPRSTVSQPDGWGWDWERWARRG